MHDNRRNVSQWYAAVGTWSPRNFRWLHRESLFQSRVLPPESHQWNRIQRSRSQKRPSNKSWNWWFRYDKVWEKIITAKNQGFNIDIKLRYFNDQPTATTDTAAHQAAVNATGKFSNFATNYEDYKNGAVERTIAGESQKNPNFRKKLLSRSFFDIFGDNYDSYRQGQAH